MATRLRAPPGGWPLAEIASALEVSLPEAAREALSRWLDLLVAWNVRVDLTAARGALELVDLMLADALVLSSRIPEGARVVDVGTGAGAPGLAVALLRPDVRVTLVEPLAKRGAFLRTVMGTVGRVDVELVGRTGQGLASVGERRWDVALARATLRPGAWLELAATLLASGGSAWVFLAREPAPVHLRMTEVESFEYAWPLTGAKRRLVRYGSGGAPRSLAPGGAPTS
jgi:16S rRNA (guanine527-N7)-methyltransferase